MVLANQLLEFTALAALLVGCALFHLRLRRASSLSFLLSIIVVALWSFFGQAMLLNTLAPPSGDSTAIDLTAAGRFQSIIAMVDATLTLWLSVSFLFAAKAIRPATRHVA